MKSSPSVFRRPRPDNETIAPVTIFDAQGRVVRIVPAAEFQRAAASSGGQRNEWPRRIARPTAGQ